MNTTTRTRLFNATGECLGIYKTREDALDALHRRPDAKGGHIKGDKIICPACHGSVWERIVPGTDCGAGECPTCTGEGTIWGNHPTFADLALDIAIINNRHVEETGKPTPTKLIDLAAEMRSILVNDFMVKAGTKNDHEKMFPVSIDVVGQYATVQFADKSMVMSSGSGYASNWEATTR